MGKKYIEPTDEERHERYKKARAVSDKDPKNEHLATEAANAQIQYEKMKALHESKGSLSELVKRTPGASASVVHKNGSEDKFLEGPKDTSSDTMKRAEKLNSRGYKEHR